MDRGRKRKAGEGEGNGGTPKRAKKSIENAETTTKIGLQLMGQLEGAKDKTGRSISTLFLTLPDKRQLPDYYQAIRLPIAIDTVTAKLQQHGYPTLTTLESDVKRMVHNAKLYNDEKSIVYGDAERIRKLLSNFMRVHNPAYASDPNYQSFPTPIPGSDDNPPSMVPVSSAAPDVAPASAPTPPPPPPPPPSTTTAPTERPKKTTITLSASSRDRKSSMAPSAPTPDATTADTDDFAGKTFQQAQEQMMNELIKYTDQEGLEIFQPFANLPSRTLTDYYKVIKRPVSLKSVKKRTIGQHGRDAPTGVSDFKSWDAFEDEVSWIWTNCREYNEDGSDMYNLAGEFEEYFKKRLATAKEAVDEPQQPRIKLNARPKTVLHLGNKSSPAPPSASAMANDQKPLAQAGANGRPTPQPHQGSSLSRSASQVPMATDALQPPSPSLPPATNAAKAEKPVAPSPVLSSGALPASTVPEPRPSVPPPSISMPPPSVPRIPSTSPHPTQQPSNHASTAYVPTPPPAPITFKDSFSRTRPVAEALLPTLHIASHPQLSLAAPPLRLDIAASPAFTHQSMTLTLPATHYYLQITPGVSAQLLSGRQYKLFVTVNGVRVMPSSKALVNGEVPMINGLGVGGAVTEMRKPAYDTALVVGVNRIEVEIVAVTARGGSLEMEKVTVFAHVLRA